MPHAILIPQGAILFFPNVTIFFFISPHETKPIELYPTTFSFLHRRQNALGGRYFIISCCFSYVNFVEFALLGKHDGRTAKILLLSLKQAVCEKLKQIINNKPFMSVLSDGSQARKTGDDKEMILVRVEKDGRFLLKLDFCFSYSAGKKPANIEINSTFKKSIARNFISANLIG